MSKTHSNVALTASLLALMTSGASAGDYKTISKSGKEADQIVEHAEGDFVVKCVGAAKGGANDCGAVDGSHACAGLSDSDTDNSDRPSFSSSESKNRCHAWDRMQNPQASVWVFVFHTPGRS